MMSALLFLVSSIPTAPNENNKDRESFKDRVRAALVNHHHHHLGKKGRIIMLSEKARTVICHSHFTGLEI